jgi:hypothetical protein
LTIAIAAEGTAAVAAGDHTHVEADVTDLAHTDADAIHDNVAGEIAAIAAKATPVSADFLVIEDSEASNAKKSITLGDLPATSAALDDLTDVTITGTPADNEVVAYDTGTSEFINQTAAEAGLATSGHAHSADDLSDVDTTTATPTIGQVLKWDGSNWVPDDDNTGSGSLPSGTTAGDLAVYNGTSWVRIGAGANDTVLTADSAQTEGVKWAAGGGSGLWDDVASGSNAGSPAASDEFSDGSWGGTTVDPASPTTTVTERYGQLSIAHPGGDAAAELHGYMIAYAPAGNFHVMASLTAHSKATHQNNQMIGVMAADGVTHGAGNQVWAGIELPNLRRDVRRHTGYDTQAAASTGTNNELIDHLWWRRGLIICLEYTSSTGVWKMYDSADGITWFHTGRTLTHSITVSHVGVMLTTWTGSNSIVGNAEFIRAYDGLLGDTVLT